MGIPWVIFVLQVIIHSGFTMTIEKGDSELIYNLTRSNDNQYTMYLRENNHVAGSDNLLLFYFKDAVSHPSCEFMTTHTFQYNLDLGSSSEYEFKSAQYFDYETQATNYILRFSSANDSEILVFINIVNIDDEPPSLTSPMCSMKENVDYNLTNTECNCTLQDPDGWLSQTNFIIINSNPNADTDLDMEDRLFEFYFDKSIPDNEYSTTVYITTLQTLDYEKNIFYSFNVQAKDGARHATTPKENVMCLIDVIDQNDQPPTWTEYFTTKQIWEEQSYDFSVTAVDGDRQINAGIEYSIISYDKDVCGEDPCISIATQNGSGIITVNPIDRDAMDLTTYKFEIMAQEIDEPPYNANITITLFIDDIDDNSPLFMSVTTNSSTTDFSDEQPKTAEFTFYENFANTIEGKIVIQDIDTGVNAQFEVLLMEDDEQTSIAKRRDQELMDYETKENNIHFTDAFIVIPSAGYRTGDFQISVKNASYLDYENPPWQNFQFYVHSRGKDKDKRKDDLLVKIHLLDYNDESPIFPLSSYSISVNETIKKGETIIQVKATDKDEADAILTHQLVAADSIAKLLEINCEEGVITVAVVEAFDYDRINPIFFQVKAIDHADPPHETIVPVTINLLDVNNKAPTYESEEIINVDENQVIGTSLNTNITASDVDTTRDLTAKIVWNKSYVTKNSQRLNTTDPVILKAMQFLDLQYDKVANDTIEIILTVNDNNENETAPDYETFDTLYLYIQITDWNTDLPEFANKMNTEAVIAININDINDNPPVFTEETIRKNRTAYENSNAGIIVGSIQAIDADVGDNVTYKCSYKIEKYDWFTCDIEGVITVSENGVIDCDTDEIETVNISCIASDGLHYTEQYFSIYILDKNNKTPYVKVNNTDPSAPVVKVEEKSEQNTFVTKINYTDADRDIPYHTAVCSFHQDTSEECFEQFYIQNNQVLVKNERSLDRDDGGIDSYECKVICVDNPNHEQEGNQNTNSTNFKIQLIDINDHCPELKTLEIVTKENLTKDSIIGEIIAEDIDEGENAAIDISILDVTRDDDSSDFTYLFTTKNISDKYYINDTYKRWFLTAKQDLRDFYGTYTLQLKLNDHGKPQKSTEDDKDLKEKSKIKLTVSRYNYYEPKFVFPYEDQPEKNKFVLSMDQEANHPLVMYEHNEVLPNINITTGPNDECLEKWKPSFDVILRGSSSSLVNFFFIPSPTDRCTAQLQVNNNFNFYIEQATSYELTISTNLSDVILKDEIEAAYTKSINLTINFADINGDPIFDQKFWNFSLPEKNETACEPLPYEAHYPNVDFKVTIIYLLISEYQNISDTFNVDPDTGAVSVRQELDYLKVNYYKFYIFAARNKNSTPKPNSQSLLQVTLYVEDVNDNTPQWTQESFFGAIMTSSQKGSTIVTVAATDLDVMDKNNLTYILNETIYRSGSESIYKIDNPFILTDDTGDIKLNFKVEYNMKGYFFFKVYVKDNEDRYGRGPHYNHTMVTIYFVTEENTLTLKFENTLDDINDEKINIIKIIGDALDWECHDYFIENDSQNGNQLTNVTAFSLYCVKNNTLLTADEIKTKLNNLDTFRKIKQELLKQSVLLMPFDSDGTKADNLEASLKAALIAVSVVLGALCMILAVTFFLKARELNRRLKQLVEPKFGSDESDLNRKGIKAPGTNLYASGANPVYNQEIKRDEYDKSSVHSGDSELIGVEDSPEFNEIFTIGNDKQRF